MEMTWTDSLRNVRTAYRVVAAYQQRVMAMMKLARREFEPLTFAGWFPTEHGTVPKTGTDPVDRWIWDFLPMQCFALALTGQDSKRYWTIQKGDCVVFLASFADSGFWEACQENSRTGPQPSKLSSEEETEASFCIYAYQWLAEPRQVDLRHDFWDHCDPEGCEEGPRKGGNGNWQMMCLELNLEQAETQEVFIKAITRFRDRVNTEFGNSLGAI